MERTQLGSTDDVEVLHGEAVAMEIALDTVYSVLCGRLSERSSEEL